MKSNRIASILIESNRELGESFQAYHQLSMHNLFDTAVNMEMGRSFLSNVFSPVLCMGITLAVFRFLGN